jgi:hypothetical protein
VGISNLLVSEIGGLEEGVFDVHSEGLERIIYQRGGISKLHERLATTTILYASTILASTSFKQRARCLTSHSTMLSFTILRGTTEPPTLQDPALAEFTSTLAGSNIFDLPQYAPHDDLSGIYGACSAATFEILSHIRTLTQTYLARWDYVSDLDPASDIHIVSCDAQLQDLYSRILLCPSSEHERSPDWAYESCRIAALIFCRSIIHGTSLANSAKSIYPRNPARESTDISLLEALHAAVMQTDTSCCWGDMRGVFLWVCLIGGAASWPSSRLRSIEHESPSPAQSWMRKCFALYSIKAAVSVPFDRAGSTIQALRTMLQVRHWVDLNNNARKFS